MASVENVIDITGLSLYIIGTDIVYPVMSANLNFTLDYYPQVNIIVSGATPEDKDQKKGAVPDTIAGLQAFLKLNYKVDETPKELVLFNGFIANCAPILEATALGAHLNLSINLVCGLAAINTLPANAYTYYYKHPVAMRAEELGAIYKDSVRVSWQEFSKDPGMGVAQLIDRHLNATTGHASNVADTLISRTGALLLTFEPTRGQAAVNTISQSVNKLLTSSSVANALMATYRTMWLHLVPETVGSEKEACRLYIQPVNAWAKTPANTKIPVLDLSSLLGMSHTTGYRFDAHDDLWLVRLPITNFIGAVYMRDKDGKASVKTYDQYKELIDTYASQHKVLRARTVPLPNWVSAAALYTTTIKATNPAISGGEETTKVDREKTEQTLKDAAKKIALLSFLEGGRNQSGMELNVPLSVYLDLLPCLGYMIKVSLPNVLNIATPDLGGLKNDRDFFGLLNGLSMQISADLQGTSIAVRCHASLTHVRDKNEQDAYASDNLGLYAGVKNTEEQG